MIFTILNKDFTISNEDGTGYNPPINPLKEKWEKLYPPIPMAQYSQVCDGYSCMGCGRCPYGDYWEVPEEDKEVWEQYQEQVREYNRIHNPSSFKSYMCEKF